MALPNKQPLNPESEQPSLRSVPENLEQTEAMLQTAEDRERLTREHQAAFVLGASATFLANYAYNRYIDSSNPVATYSLAGLSTALLTPPAAEYYFRLKEWRSRQ